MYLYYIIINQCIIVGKGLVSSELGSKYIEQSYNLIPSEYIQIFLGIYTMSCHDKIEDPKLSVLDIVWTSKLRVREVPSKNRKDD
jgi:hypothetical protein